MVTATLPTGSNGRAAVIMSMTLPNLGHHLSAKASFLVVILVMSAALGAVIEEAQRRQLASLRLPADTRLSATETTSITLSVRDTSWCVWLRTLAAD